MSYEFTKRCDVIGESISQVNDLFCVEMEEGEEEETRYILRNNKKKQFLFNVSVCVS